MIIKYIKIPIYNHTIELIIFNKLDDLYSCKYWEFIKDDFNSGSMAITIDYPDKQLNTIIVQRYDLGSLVHELVHVKSYINKYYSLDLSVECEAYLMGYLFDRCCKFVK